jgi:ABC-type branched-subunit amino acid transport system substrate-binding protein
MGNVTTARALLAGAASLAALSLGCASSDGSGAHVTVGVLLPYTGEASALSANLEKGSLLAVEEMNRAGGVGGLPVEIVFGNTFSDAERTSEQARALVERGAVVVIGPGGDEGAEPAYHALAELGVPLLSPLSSASAEADATGELPWFRMAPTTRVLGENLAKLVGDSGAHEIGAIVANDIYHSQLGAAFLDRVRAYGSIEMQLNIDESSVNIQALAQTISERLDAGLEGVMLAMHPRPAARLATELSALRGSRGMPQWFLTPRLKTALLLENASPGALRDAVGIAPEVFAGTRGEFEEHFQARSGDLPFDPTFFVYDATAVALLAIDRALAQGETLPAGVPQAIEQVASFGGVLIRWSEFTQARAANQNGSKLQYTGLTGPVILNDDGSRLIGTTSLWGVQDEAIIER